MRVKRRRKINRVNPVDFGLEELSKINKENVVRIMDRSKERTGEKLSSQSGLYVPTSGSYEVMRDSSDKGNISKRKVLSETEIEDYNFGKTFAVGEQYLDNEKYNFRNYNENYSYDDFEDTEDFSLEGFFDEIENQVNTSRQTERKYVDDGTIKVIDGDAQESSEDSEAVNNGLDQATQLRELAKQAQDIKVIEQDAEDIAQDVKIIEQDAEDAEQDARDIAQDVKDIAHDDKDDSFADIREGMGGVKVNEIDPEREVKLREVIINLERAATPKERLALEREAIRLGMANVLTEYDGSDMVRPELLEEIGFTPGGDKEPEIVKNKRFRFGKKNNKNKSETTSELEKEVKLENSSEDVESKPRTTIAEKKVTDNRNKKTNTAKTLNTSKKPSAQRERRSEVMHDSEKRRNYILKNKKRLEKASEDLMKMQEKYENLTDCINDMVLLDDLPKEVEDNIKNTAGMVVKYRHETEKTKGSAEMDKIIYRKMEQNKDELPDVIRRLIENEKYSSKIKNNIERLEEEKNSCQDITQDNVHRQKVTKNISIAVIILTVFTMVALIIIQLASEYDMQIPILIFGACAILETLGIFVQHFKTETDETLNHHKLNKLIKKQNAEKLKYVNAVNAVEYVYKKYDIHSSSELLFQWETYQRVAQAREDYRIAGNEARYYEDRLFNLLQKYGFNNPRLWVSHAEYLVEEMQLMNVKDEMTQKRSKLMVRMDKCKKVIGRLDNEFSVLVIKFPQYAKEIKELLQEF